MSWTGGYLSDLEYTFGYYPELSPLQARLALANRGVQSVDLSCPTYLELGFGQGLSINAHAAAIPGDWWGSDFNPAQAARAMEMAAASGSGAHLCDQSFAELAARTDLPAFDMIAAHGIWTWVPLEARRAILDIAHRRLKPGGVLYLSYNVTPGWAPMVPVRHLLRLHASRASTEGAGALARLEASVGFVEKLAEAGATYFRSYPKVLERLQAMKGKDRKYLAHEFLNEEWRPVPFADLLAELEPAKLAFAAPAALVDHLDRLHLSSEAQAFLQGVADGVLRESARDCFVNRQFRRDYFVRGPRAMPKSAQTAALESLRAVLCKLPADVVFEAKGALGTSRLQEAIYAPVVEALAADGMRPKTFAEVGRVVAPRGLVFPQVAQAITLLVGKGDAALAHDEATTERVRARTTALNRHLIEQAHVSSDIAYLASPVTGGGVTVTRIEQLFLLALGEGRETPESWARSAWEALAAQGHRVMKDDKRLDSEEENLAELGRRAREFEAKRLACLRVLGIV